MPHLAPCDCETAEEALLRTKAFHAEQAAAFWMGQEYQLQQVQKAANAQGALADLFPDRYKTLEP